MTWESQNLPALPEMPMTFNLEEREFLKALKELLEVMLGRRGEQPLTPQIQMGSFIGDGSTSNRLIETNFRPRYIKLFPAPESSDNEWTVERIDDPDQSLDWGGFSFWHDGSAHVYDEDTGIVGIIDAGFYINGAGDIPNVATEATHWIAFG